MYIESNVLGVLYKTPWGPDQVQKLKQLAAEKLSASRIAAQMDFPCSRNAIIGKCDREGIPLIGPKGEGARTYHHKVKRHLKRNYAEEIIRRRAAQKAPPGFISQEIAPIEPLRISIVDLEDFHCRAVTGETDDHCCPTYCGHPVVYRSWCAAHAKVNYQWVRR